MKSIRRGPGIGTWATCRITGRGERVRGGVATWRCARQVRAKDFQEFDLIVALDRMNLRDLQRWHGAVPEKVRLARSFDSSAENLDVPDPYYGTIEDFEEVADMLERACEGILDRIVDGRLVGSGG